MSSVTLELPDHILRQAEQIANRTQRRVEDVLTDWMDRYSAEMPIDELSDDEVLALADLQMTDYEQQELDRLLTAQREGELEDLNAARLNTLIQLYRRGLVRKAQAIQVAVERGLRAPLS